jgi:hypothetical protein
MYAIYGNIYHQYTPNVSIYTIHGFYGLGMICNNLQCVCVAETLIETDIETGPINVVPPPVKPF